MLKEIRYERNIYSHTTFLFQYRGEGGVGKENHSVCFFALLTLHLQSIMLAQGNWNYEQYRETYI